MCLAGPVGAAAKLTVDGDRSSGIEGNEAIRLPHTRLCAIFFLWADNDKRERTGSNANFRPRCRYDAGHQDPGVSEYVLQT